VYYYSNQQSQYTVRIAIYTKWGGKNKQKKNHKQKSKPHHIRVISEGSCDTEDWSK